MQLKTVKFPVALSLHNQVYWIAETNLTSDTKYEFGFYIQLLNGDEYNYYRYTSVHDTEEKAFLSGQKYMLNYGFNIRPLHSSKSSTLKKIPGRLQFPVYVSLINANYKYEKLRIYTSTNANIHRLIISVNSIEKNTIMNYQHITDAFVTKEKAYNAGKNFLAEYGFDIAKLNELPTIIPE